MATIGIKDDSATTRYSVTKKDVSGVTVDVSTEEGNRHYEKPHQEACVICLTALTTKTRAVATPCLHACFDFGCLVTWLEGVQATCPVCKQTIETVKYGFDPVGTGFHKYKVKTPVASPNTSQQGSASRTSSSRQRRAESRRHLPYAISTSLTSKPADDILRRRFVYKNKLRSLHIGVNRKSRFQNYTPQSIRSDPELLSKAKAFIRRELEVFEWTEGNREWLLEYVVAIVKSINLRSAEGSAEELLEEFLGKDYAGVFVHELNAYLKSPFVRVRDYDSWAQYTIPIPKELDRKDMQIVGRPSDGNG